VAVEDTQDQWQAIFDKVKNDCPDKKHVPHRHAKDEPEKAKAHFTGCPQASENGPATEQHASAHPALLPIGEAQPCGGRVMGIESLSDESVLRFYEDIRQQVAADLGAGNRYRFMGEAAKQQAERLRIEIAPDASAAAENLDAPVEAGAPPQIRIIEQINLLSEARR
jgi:hypothetical protein